MGKCNRIIRPIISIITLSVGASASAQTIYPFKGSDTLFDVMTDAVAAYRAEKGPANYVEYAGTGSGNGEKAMATHTVTPWQRIAPMSRNLTSSALSICEVRVGAGLCRAELKNVLGLDAAVTVEGRGAFTSCTNLPLGTDPADPTTAPDGNRLQLILGGKGGTGSWKDCSSPERVAAIQALLDCNVGLGQFTHWYRRDDSSGTSDTMREKLKIARFCNGEGKPPAGVAGANLQNPDNDPIRTDCPASTPSRKAVRCTITDPAASGYLTDCSNNPTATGCTAGFLISLSEPDSAAVTDITMTIAARVLADSTTVGYAGREAIRRAPVAGQPAAGPTINTNTPSNSNVRQDKYLLSRRLWLQDTVDQNDTPVTTNSTGDVGRDAAEAEFFDWATSPLGVVSAKPGRENMDPIMIKWGFIPCTDDFSQPTGDGNLCSKNFGASGFPPGAGAPTKCVVNSISAGAYQATACTPGADVICCSDGLACNDPSHGGNSCPAPAGRPAGYACKYNSDCASGNCDGFATASTGTCL